ncbi:D-aminoacyl-tRNA deacylase [Limisalsivibrio acetivorans]|uniref:D-aminoacyl-tRNA deacylase n=1 Tax=Limisalsivibrio acetivorans TaxID=1304888 RepID=UPI0003B385BC|nr:D-aminoacyl-tRNA deacylase [Limisalsivibrio acetivorans]
MKLCIQRVSSAFVKVNGESVSEIDKGLLILFGAEEGDRDEYIDYLARKACGLRIFERDGKMNDSVKDIDGEVIVVSQFTLAGKADKGLRPDFTNALEPVEAERMYELFLDRCRAELGMNKVGSGVFREYMEVGLVNDGPVTIILEKKE